MAICSTIFAVFPAAVLVGARATTVVGLTEAPQAAKATTPTAAVSPPQTRLTWERSDVGRGT
jgi:hypothetical protein